MTWGRKNISDVYCSSSDLQFLVKYKMDAILHIYYKHNDVILNTKKIKACYNNTVIRYSFECLATLSVVLRRLFFYFFKQMLFMIL